MKQRILPWLAAAAALAAALPARADVSLPKVFGSHMVLQRDRPIPVWGWAAPGEEVSVRLGDRPAVKATANGQGEWRVKLPALPAGGPFTLTVTGKNTVTLDDVLIGEVWLCSGQSNMEWPVGASLNFPQEAAAANLPQIRHIKVKCIAAPQPAKDVELNLPWQVCSPETVGNFTACGYFMARELYRELKVPIGLVNSSWGGTMIEPWTPPVGFDAVPSLEAFRRQILLADPRTGAYKEGIRNYLNTLEQWIQTARATVPKGEFVPPMPAFPAELQPLTRETQPSTLYNAMIHPLIPFAIRGAIWYQGESNHWDGMLYTDKMKALVNGWRQLWGQGDFPFYYVQIAPFNYGNEDPNAVATFWEAQAAAQAIPNTGMVVTNDIGDLNDIHPKNKQEVGRRLALWALAKTYGRKEVVCAGPVYRSMAVEGAKLRVRFDNARGGLVSRDGKPLTWFEIAGKGADDWVAAEAVIEGDSVLLSSPEVTEPTGVRFAWHRNAEPNLSNKEGLPAAAFRAGTVPPIDFTTLDLPEAQGYELVYALNLAKAGANITYDVDRRAQIRRPFDRIAYFLELRKPGEQKQYLFVSMDAFTDDLAKIGVPTVASQAVFQQPVTNLQVVSNVPGIVNGEGLAGNIEFWPHNYGPLNASGVPNASAEVWDFGDQYSDPVDGYGSMQVHNPEAKQTLFAFNNWKAGASADIGIGNSDLDARTRDWTFAANAGSYSRKTLRVLVRLK
ncbi:MAG: sialate O-acetylesterase [Armatimonadetes bacterium]|nr:sialate O-acetylesterase [Armatimonadota bacterium]